MTALPSGGFRSIRRLGMMPRWLLSSCRTYGPVSAASTGANTGYITSADELTQLAQKVIADGLPISLDCETGYEGEDRSYKNTSPSLHPEEAILAGYNFTNAVSWGRYVPLGHDEARYNIDPYPSACALWDMVSTGLAVVHNADMEERMLSRWMLEHLADDKERGEAVRATSGYFPILSDTMMEAHALARWKSIALKSLSREVFDYEQVELRDLFGQINGKVIPANRRYTLRFTVLDPSDPRVYNYACDDVIQTLRLHQRHYPQVKDNFIYWLEMNDWPIVWAMEDEGLAVDWDFIDEAKGRAHQFRNKMQAGLVNHLTDRLGKLPAKFNPGSHPQVRKVLYNRADDEEQPGLGLMTHILTKGKKDGSNKQLSTSALALKGISADPFVRRMQDYRGMSKLLQTYLENWRKEFGWCECGRAHCHLLPHGAGTGRFSSSDFNYQNLPKKYHYECDGSSFDFNFRDCVVAPPGWVGMGFDISQGELRIIAAEAGETAMLEAFANGEDLHALTACRLLNLTMDEMQAGGELGGKQYPPAAGGFRPFGKTMNFALGYQLSVQGLADRLGCSVEEAGEHFANYFAVYSNIAQWTRRTVADSKVNGFTSSRLGRRHPIWAYESDKSWVYQGGERTAGNAPIQGGLADMMKLIMIRVHEALKEAGLLDVVRLVMNIHDALEFYVREDISPQLVIDLLTPVILQKTPWTEHWPLMKPDWHIWWKWGSPIELDLDENGQITGMGEVIDIGVQEEDDDDDEEEDDGPAAVAMHAIPLASGARPPHADTVRHTSGIEHPPHRGRVVIRVEAMPELAALQRLGVLIREFPGSNQIVFATPEGSTEIGWTSLSPDDAPRISLTLGGASVTWDTSTVDNSKLAEGMAL